MKTLAITHSETSIRMMRLSVLWSVVALMIMTSSARADIYFWQDEEGVIHFSNQDVPASAGLYMREPAPLPPAVRGNPHKNPDNRTQPDPAAIRRQIKTEVKLEEANRKLDAALDKVADLTEQVERSQARADASAEQARLAALEAGRQASAAEEMHETDHRTIVYAVPYRPHYRSRGMHPHKANQFQHRKKQITVKHSRTSRHAKKHKNIKANRRFNAYGPRPVLPPGKTYIPSAYGIGVRSRIPSAYGVR